MYNEKIIHYHKSRRNRKTGKMQLAAMLIIVIMTVVVLPMIWPVSTEAMERIQVVTVTVERGDSLWSIADRYDNNSMDLRQYIDLVESFNHLENSVLQPGQQIRIPLYPCKN